MTENSRNSEKNATFHDDPGLEHSDSEELCPVYGHLDKRFREKQFLLSCERGDIGTVKNLLAITDYVNINCVDPLGRSALLIAIENENTEMIELLLDNNIETGDAILHAIGEENLEAVEIIVEHLEKIDKFSPENQGVEINEYSAFTPDITPIILAAQKDNYECIKLFWIRKARCLIHMISTAVVRTVKRPAKRIRYDCLYRESTPTLSWELKRLSYIENEFRTEYQELSQKCQNFSVNMLDQIRGSKELEIVLNHTTTAWQEVTARVTSTPEQLARLKLAIKLNQKSFVAHHNCQQLLAGIWYEGLGQGFRNRNIIYKCLLITAVGLSFPILSISYLIAPTSTIAQFIRRPIVKFVSHSASYIVFLLLLLMSSQRIDEVDNMFREKNSPDRKEVRGPPPTPVEMAIIIWVLGFIWVEIKQIWKSGLCEYSNNLWNILDFITNSLYISTFALRVVAYYQVSQEMNNPKMRHIGRFLQRKDWDAWDPTLLSECVFATANIFSSLKLVDIFTVNPYLGPLKISLGRMVIDILKFFLIYVLVLFAFACGLNQLLWYYGSMRGQECNKYMDLLAKPASKINFAKLESLKDSCDPKYRSVSSIYYASETLFWAMFGQIDLSHFSLKQAHYLTEWTGRTIFGSYSCFAIIVLLNMLIAMMSNSYQYISNQCDMEWKFARSRLFLDYFDDAATLPPPFNIIPSPKSFYYGLTWLCERCFKHSKRIQVGRHNSNRNQKILRVVNDLESNYRFVTRNLVKRYVAQMQRVKQKNEGVTEDDVNEIKQDISAFRYELLGILQSAGFKTGHTDYNQTRHTRNKKRSAIAERRLKKGLPEFNIPIPESFQDRKSSLASLTSEIRQKLVTPVRLPNLNWRQLKRKVGFRDYTQGSPTSVLSHETISLANDYDETTETTHMNNVNNVSNGRYRKASGNGRPPLRKQSSISETMSTKGLDDLV
ncbi:anthranilate synthase component I [Parelaphostrongylus tenuis]|uniref:Anthranilate synthase component I n=1 Tax=Parelaphostrongylus tenuis TaxID=148309 RepID=A0AAD5QZ52_PARTN|nr:anthranilate synthase component I [Parelaphostrongylus tenuis]